MTTVRAGTRYARTCRNGPPSLPFGTPGANEIVCVPGSAPAPGEQHRARDPLARARLVLPDPGAVEGLAPVDEHARVAGLAAALAERSEQRDRRAVEVDHAGRAERARDPPGAGPGARRGAVAPVGSSAAAAISSARPPFVCQAVTSVAGGGPSKKRPNEPSGARAESAAAAFVRIHCRANGRVRLGRERVHRLDERLDDVVLGLEVGEHAGAVGEIRRDRLRARHRLVEVALDARDPARARARSRSCRR